MRPSVRTPGGRLGFVAAALAATLSVPQLADNVQTIYRRAVGAPLDELAHRGAASGCGGSRRRQSVVGATHADCRRQGSSNCGGAAGDDGLQSHTTACARQLSGSSGSAPSFSFFASAATVPLPDQFSPIVSVRFDVPLGMSGVDWRRNNVTLSAALQASSLSGSASAAAAAQGGLTHLACGGLSGILYVFSTESYVDLWGTPNPAPVKTLDTGSAIGLVRWRPSYDNSRVVAVGGVGGQLSLWGQTEDPRLWDAAGLVSFPTAHARTAGDTSAYLSDMGWSADGVYLATVGSSGTFGYGTGTPAAGAAARPVLYVWGDMGSVPDWLSPIYIRDLSTLTGAQGGGSGQTPTAVALGTPSTPYYVAVGMSTPAITFFGGNGGNPTEWTSSVLATVNLMNAGGVQYGAPAGLAFSPSGSHLAVAVETALTGTNPGGASVLIYTVSFNRASALAGTAGAFSVSTFPVVELAGLNANPTSLSFAPNGASLAASTAAGDGSVVIWGASNHVGTNPTSWSVAPINILTGYHDSAYPVPDVAWSVDGAMVASVGYGDDSTMRVYAVPLPSASPSPTASASPSYVPPSVSPYPSVVVEQSLTNPAKWSPIGVWAASDQLVGADWDPTQTYVAYTACCGPNGADPETQIYKTTSTTGTWIVGPVQTLVTGLGVSIMKYRPDGTSLAVGKATGTVSLWGVVTADPTAWPRDSELVVLTVPSGAAVNDIAWSRNGENIAVASADGMVNVWGGSYDFFTWSSTPAYSFADPARTGSTVVPATSLTWVPTGVALFVGYDDGVAQLLAADPTGAYARSRDVTRWATTPVRTWSLHQATVTSLAVVDTGLYLASASADGVVSVWGGATPTTNPIAWDTLPAFTVTDDTNTAIRRLAWSRRGDYLAAAMAKPVSTIRIFGYGNGTADPSTWTSTPTTTLPGHPNGDIFALTWGKLGHRLMSAAGNDDNKVMVWGVPDPSITPSATPSSSVSRSITPSVSPSASLSMTPSRTPSRSPTSSPTKSTTPSVTPTVSSTPTVTITRSSSPTSSTTPSRSTTPSTSTSPSITPSTTPSTSVTPSLTPSRTPSRSFSKTPEPTPWLRLGVLRLGSTTFPVYSGGLANNVTTAVPISIDALDVMGNATYASVALPSSAGAGTRCTGSGSTSENVFGYASRTTDGAGLIIPCWDAAAGGSFWSAQQVIATVSLSSTTSTSSGFVVNTNTYVSTATSPYLLRSAAAASLTSGTTVYVGGGNPAAVQLSPLYSTSPPSATQLQFSPNIPVSVRATVLFEGGLYVSINNGGTARGIYQLVPQTLIDTGLGSALPVDSSGTRPVAFPGIPPTDLAATFDPFQFALDSIVSLWTTDTHDPTAASIYHYVQTQYGATGIGDKWSGGAVGAWVQESAVLLAPEPFYGLAVRCEWGRTTVYASTSSAVYRYEPAAAWAGGSIVSHISGSASYGGGASVSVYRALVLLPTAGDNPLNEVCPSPTPSVTPSSSVTPSRTPSFSTTPSRTPSTSITPSITPTLSITPSPSITPSITPSPSVTPSGTPSLSIPPTITPTRSITPSGTPVAYPPYYIALLVAGTSDAPVVTGGDLPGPLVPLSIAVVDPFTAPTAAVTPGPGVAALGASGSTVKTHFLPRTPSDTTDGSTSAAAAATAVGSGASTSARFACLGTGSADDLRTAKFSMSGDGAALFFPCRNGTVRAASAFVPNTEEDLLGMWSAAGALRVLSGLGLDHSYTGLLHAGTAFSVKSAGISPVGGTTMVIGGADTSFGVGLRTLSFVTTGTRLETTMEVISETYDVAAFATYGSTVYVVSGPPGDTVGVARITQSDPIANPTAVTVTRLNNIPDVTISTPFAPRALAVESPESLWLADSGAPTVTSVYGYTYSADADAWYATKRVFISSDPIRSLAGRCDSALLYRSAGAYTGGWVLYALTSKALYLHNPQSSQTYTVATAPSYAAFRAVANVPVSSAAMLGQQVCPSPSATVTPSRTPSMSGSPSPSTSRSPSRTASTSRSPSSTATVTATPGRLNALRDLAVLRVGTSAFPKYSPPAASPSASAVRGTTAAAAATAAASPSVGWSRRRPRAIPLELDVFNPTIRLPGGAGAPVVNTLRFPTYEYESMSFPLRGDGALGDGNPGPGYADGVPTTFYPCTGSDEEGGLTYVGGATSAAYKTSGQAGNITALNAGPSYYNFTWKRGSGATNTLAGADWAGTSAWAGAAPAAGWPRGDSATFTQPSMSNDGSLLLVGCSSAAPGSDWYGAPKRVVASLDGYGHVDASTYVQLDDGQAGLALQAVVGVQQYELADTATGVVPAPDPMTLVLSVSDNAPDPESGVPYPGTAASAPLGAAGLHVLPYQNPGDAPRVYLTAVKGIRASTYFNGELYVALAEPRAPSGATGASNTANSDGDLFHLGNSQRSFGRRGIFWAVGAEGLLPPSPSPSSSASASPSASSTASWSMSPSPTSTESSSASPSMSASGSASASASASESASGTVSASASPSASFSETPMNGGGGDGGRRALRALADGDPSETPSPSTTPSTTRSVSMSPSTSRSPSRSASTTRTPSVSPSRSVAATRTVTRSVTTSVTPSASESATGTMTVTPSKSITVTRSVTPTSSRSPSRTVSATPTASVVRGDGNVLVQLKGVTGAVWDSTTRKLVGAGLDASGGAATVMDPYQFVFESASSMWATDVSYPTLASIYRYTLASDGLGGTQWMLSRAVLLAETEVFTGIVGRCESAVTVPSASPFTTSYAGSFMLYVSSSSSVWQHNPATDVSELLLRAPGYAYFAGVVPLPRVDAPVVGGAMGLVCGSPSPSATPTRSVSPSRTPSSTMSPSGTVTRSSTLTPSRSRSASRSVTASLTPSASTSPSTTASMTASPSCTRSESSSPSRTVSPSRSRSTTSSRTPSTSRTVSITPSVTVTATITVSGSVTPSNTRTPSRSMTPSQTSSETASPSTSPSATTSASVSTTPTTSMSRSPSSTPSMSSSPSSSASVTPSRSVSPSRTPTRSGSTTVTPSLSSTSTVSTSMTPSASMTATVTVSVSVTPSGTVTPSSTRTPSSTVTPSTTVTRSGSVTRSVSASASRSTTHTSTVSVSVTPSASMSTTVSPSASVSVTPSVTPSQSIAPEQRVSVRLGLGGVPVVMDPSVAGVELGSWWNSLAGVLSGDASAASTNATGLVGYLGGVPLEAAFRPGGLVHKLMTTVAAVAGVTRDAVSLGGIEFSDATVFSVPASLSTAVAGASSTEAVGVPVVTGPYATAAGGGVYIGNAWTIVGSTVPRGVGAVIAGRTPSPSPYAERVGTTSRRAGAIVEYVPVEQTVMLQPSVGPAVETTVVNKVAAYSFFVPPDLQIVTVTLTLRLSGAFGDLAPPAPPSLVLCKPTMPGVPAEVSAALSFCGNGAVLRNTASYALKRIAVALIDALVAVDSRVLTRLAASASANSNNRRALVDTSALLPALQPSLSTAFLDFVGGVQNALADADLLLSTPPATSVIYYTAPNGVRRVGSAAAELAANPDATASMGSILGSWADGVRLVTVTYGAVPSPVPPSATPSASPIPVSDAVPTGTLAGAIAGSVAGLLLLGVGAYFALTRTRRGKAVLIKLGLVSDGEGEDGVEEDTVKAWGESGNESAHSSRPSSMVYLSDPVSPPPRALLSVPSRRLRDDWLPAPKPAPFVHTNPLYGGAEGIVESKAAPAEAPSWSSSRRLMQQQRGAVWDNPASAGLLVMPAPLPMASPTPAAAAAASAAGLASPPAATSIPVLVEGVQQVAPALAAVVVSPLARAPAASAAAAPDVALGAPRQMLVKVASPTEIARIKAAKAAAAAAAVGGSATATPKRVAPVAAPAPVQEEGEAAAAEATEAEPETAPVAAPALAPEAVASFPSAERRLSFPAAVGPHVTEAPPAAVASPSLGGVGSEEPVRHLELLGTGRLALQLLQAARKAKKNAYPATSTEPAAPVAAAAAPPVPAPLLTAPAGPALAPLSQTQSASLAAVQTFLARRLQANASVLPPTSPGVRRYATSAQALKVAESSSTQLRSLLAANAARLAGNEAAVRAAQATLAGVRTEQLGIAALLTEHKKAEAARLAALGLAPAAAATAPSFEEEQAAAAAAEAEAAAFAAAQAEAAAAAEAEAAAAAAEAEAAAAAEAEAAAAAQAQYEQEQQYQQYLAAAEAEAAAAAEQQQLEQQQQQYEQQQQQQMMDDGTGVPSLPPGEYTYLQDEVGNVFAQDAAGNYFFVGSAPMLPGEEMQGEQ